MFEWLQSLGGDLKSILIATFGSIAGAVVGGVIKWLFDRAMIKELRQQREDARKDRQAAIEGRESAVKEREAPLNDLARREAEIHERQRKMDDLQRELDSDPSVGKAEWAAIANRYRNAPTNGSHVYKFRSNKEARAAIRDAFIERHEASSKRGILNRLTKWAS